MGTREGTQHMQNHSHAASRPLLKQNSFSSLVVVMMIPMLAVSLRPYNAQYHDLTACNIPNPSHQDSPARLPKCSVYPALSEFSNPLLSFFQNVYSSRLSTKRNIIVINTRGLVNHKLHFVRSSLIPLPACLCKRCLHLGARSRTRRSRCVAC